MALDMTTNEDDTPWLRCETVGRDDTQLDTTECNYDDGSALVGAALKVGGEIREEGKGRAWEKERSTGIKKTIEMQKRGATYNGL